MNEHRSGRVVAEIRDREIEDYLARLERRIAELEAQVAVLTGQSATLLYEGITYE